MWVMLSPQEREPAPGKSLNGEHSPALENLLPLPGGEGWGEGEREFQLNKYGFRPRSRRSMRCPLHRIAILALQRFSVSTFRAL